MMLASTVLAPARSAKPIEDLLGLARQRGMAAGVGYAGLLSPVEAHRLVREHGAIVVDVRARAEWDLVGRVPGSVLIEWRGYPCTDPNPRFVDELREEVDPEDPVLFLCRSGQRSHDAAEAAAAAGFRHVFNILEGFEGDLDDNRRRSSVGGWRRAGLPWIQN